MTQRRIPLKYGGGQKNLNPYSVAIRIFLKRLLWDFSLDSWRHRKRLSSLKDQRVGEKAVICCNGPSLLDTDWGLLDGTFTFGLNKINLMFEDYSFRPSCIVAVNPFIIDQNRDFFAKTDIPLFLDSYAKKLGLGRSLNTNFLNSCDFPSFAKDCSISIFQGFTVTYVALQLAYHMGFRKVALIGCDHKFDLDVIPNQVITQSGSDKNHFSSQYFGEGDSWQYPDLLASELYYTLARSCYEEEGRQIVNASISSQLEVFSKTSLEEFLSYE